jgi:hypothetical protein
LQTLHLPNNSFDARDKRQAFCKTNYGAAHKLACKTGKEALRSAQSAKKMRARR